LFCFITNKNERELSEGFAKTDELLFLPHEKEIANQQLRKGKEENS